MSVGYIPTDAEVATKLTGLPEKYAHVWTMLRRYASAAFDVSSDWRNAEPGDLVDEIVGTVRAALAPMLDDAIVRAHREAVAAIRAEAAEVPELRRFKDRDDTGIWFEIKPDRFVYAYTPGDAAEIFAEKPGSDMSYAQIKHRYGPLAQLVAVDPADSAGGAR